MDNNIQVEIIREYLIDNKMDFDKENIIGWINKYAEKFRDILNKGIDNIDDIKKLLYT